MKLWVDDIRSAPDETWNVARSSLAAIRAIARYDFKEISLDHDISHQVGMGKLSRPYPCDETFMSVVYFICEKYVDKPSSRYPKLTLHTSNVVAADEMEALFTAHGLPCEKKLMGLANRLEQHV